MSLIHLRLLGGVQVSVCEDDNARRLTLAPKPMAVLAYLAVAGVDGPPVRRDVLLALFWPELSSPKARAALRQMLFHLRRALGDGVLVADRDTVSLEPNAVECDVVSFERLLERGERSEAIDIYRGPLLDGFFVDGMSAQFETWIDGQRTRVARKAFAACGALADDAERNRNGIAAARWARAAVDLVPDDEIAVRRLIGTLATFGDSAGALRVADEFARVLEREFGSVPSAETETLVSSIRAGRVSTREWPHATPPPPVVPAAAPSSASAIGRGIEIASERLPVAPGQRKLVRSRGSLAAMLIMVLSAAALWIAQRRADGMRPFSGGSPNAPPMTIASPVARRLYFAGLDRYRAGDNREGVRLLDEALADDSGCAMCAYYAARADEGVDDDAGRRMLNLAIRLSDRVSEPERLLIHFGWADLQNSLNRRAVAESLVTKYPSWAEAQVAAGEAAMMDGDWSASIDHLRRAIAEDPARDSASAPNAIASAAGVMLIRAYEVADSMPSALREARALVAKQAGSRMVWLLLSHVLSRSGRFDEARAALDSSTRYAGGSDDDLLEHADVEIRAGNFTTADQILRALAKTGDPHKRADALWILTISLRTQGRLRAALDIATGPLRQAESTQRQVAGISLVAEAQTRLELGEAARAADLFSTEARADDSLMRTAPASVARQRAWMDTQSGAALAAEGDTEDLLRLADTVRAWGEMSGLGRDRRLHLYLRGLLWTARARPDSAEPSFRAATVSETDGFSRVNLARARALMALGRPSDAIPVLSEALGGPIDAGNTYVTRTELQYELARAYDMAGISDSAVVYYADVVNAWRDADPQFDPSVARARRRLEADEHMSHHAAVAENEKAPR